MRIIGCDLHARQQTLAILETTPGEIENRTLLHEGNQVRELYTELTRTATMKRHRAKRKGGHSAG